MRRGRSCGFVSVCLLVIAAGCDSGKSDRRGAADRIVERLEALPPGPAREAITAVSLNAMCSIGRLAAGEAEGRVETAVAGLVFGQPDDVRARLVGYRETLGAIPEAKRTELLGDLGGLDPAACEAAPAWDLLRTAVLFANQPIPHLRCNFCSNNFSYPDGEPGDRAITVGSLLTAIHQDPDGVHPATHELASLATPSFTGIELSDDVFARDPVLAATESAGEGITPYGADTGIPCSSSSNACNASLGQMCQGGTCMSFPVVKKDATMVVRGYNLWDVTDARLVFEPLVPGQGSESTAVIRDFDTNEPTDQVAACTLPSAPQSATFNRAHFRVPANEGHFYRLRLFNHNGTFLTQADGADDGEPRVIHTCFPTSPVGDNVPPGTVRDCTPPVETCVQDGLACTATWGASPRKLEDCRHQPGQAPPCGETPEWYEAQLLSPRVQGLALVPNPIVFVEGSASPVFTLRGTLHALETIDETGFQNLFGSDEPMVALFGADLSSPTVPEIGSVGNVFRGGDFDAGDRDIVDKLLVQNDLPADGSLIILALLAEDDGFLGAFLAGLAGIAAATALIIATGGLALITALGGAAGVAAVWAVIVTNSIAPDDQIGMESFSASVLDVSQRVGATHAPTFLSQPHTIGILPEIPAGPRADARGGFLVHPFAEFSSRQSPLPECDPGDCGTGEECQVNICVPIGFVDPIANTGFRERRQYTGADGHYAMDLQWEIEPKQ
jgi:hypothetical protein